MATSKKPTAVPGGNRVDHFEFKIPLKASKLDSFAESQISRIVDSVVRSAAKGVPGVDVNIDATVIGTSTVESKVLFLDTPSFDLRKNGNILRLRHHPDRKDLTLKFRGPDTDVVASGDVSYYNPDAEERKFKYEVVGTGKEEDPYKIEGVYANNNQIKSTAGEGCISDPLPSQIKGWCELFPGLKKLNLEDETLILPVHGMIAKQFRCEIGKIVFTGAMGGKIKASAEIILWQNFAHPDNVFERELSAEFCCSFKVGKKHKEIPPDAYSVCQQFFHRLQDAPYQPWIDYSGMKTKSIYDPPVKERVVSD